MNVPRQISEETASIRMGEILDEYLDRASCGERPSIEQYAQRHPELADVIRKMLPTLEVMQISAGPARTADSRPSDEFRPEGPLGDFRIVRELGRGGMGIVYEAQQISLGRRVALKVLPFAAVLDPRQLQRFKNEAQAAAGLHHQNIVPVYGVGCERGVHYYAMQYVEGQTLAEVVRDLRRLEKLDGDPSQRRSRPGLAEDATSGRFPSPQGGNGPNDVSAPQSLPVTPKASSSDPDTTRQMQAALSTERSTKSPTYLRSITGLGVQVAEALEHAHQQGVVHRDIKPSNLILDSHGTVWVTDFGLARIESNAELTLTGDILGTLRYMSPEQALAKRILIDHRTDIYSLGVTLYELLTLRPACRGDDREGLLRQIAFEEPILPRRLNKAVPAELETVLLKAMAKNPAERYESAQDLADDLQRFLDDKPIHARRPTLRKRLAKWSRRQRALVWSMSAAAAILLLATAVGGLLLAAKQSEIAKQKGEIAGQERERRVVSERAKQRETSLLASSYVDRAQSLCEQREIGRGMLWLARALEIAPESDAELSRAIRTGLAAWHRRLHSLQTVIRHPDSVGAVAFTPDGSQFLTACRDGSVRFCDTATEKMAGEPLKHGARVFALTISPDGSRIATGGDDGMVRLWDANTRQPIGKPIRQRLHFSTNSLAFSPDGSHLMTINGDWSTVGLWDARTGEPLGKGFEYEGVGRCDVRAAAYCPGGLRVVAIFGESGLIQMYGGDGKSIGPAVKSPLKKIRRVAISPDGSRFAIVGIAGNMYVWDAATGQLAVPLIVHGGVVRCLTFSSDGSRIASGGNTRAALLWDAATGEPVGAPLRQRDTVNAVAFSPDGSRIVTGNAAGVVRLWTVARHDSPSLAGQHEQEVISAAFSPDGLRMLTRGDGTLQLSSGATGEAVGKAFPDEGHQHAQLVFSPDGSQVLVRPPFGGQLRDVATGAPIRHEFPPSMHRVVFSPDGSRILAGFGDNVARLWDAVTGEQLGELRQHERSVSSVAFSPDGSRILTGSYDGTTQLWDTATLDPVGSPLVHPSEVKGVDFSPDGTKIVVGFADGTVRLWNADTLKPLGTPLQYVNIVCSLAFSPDGSRFLACSIKKTARLWDTDSLTPIGPPFDYNCWWPRGSFSPDGTQILIADGSGAVYLWEAPPGALQGNREQVVCWTEVVTGLELDPTGGIVALDAPTWLQRRRRLRTLGGPPTSAPLAPPASKVETDFSRALQLAARGRDYARQGLFDEAVSDFDVALALSRNSPTLREQIACWCRDLSKKTLPGDKIELSGTTLDGAPFDWNDYQGKFVLLEFWPTSLDSYRRELTIVRKNYSLYRDRGLDCVGISATSDLNVPDRNRDSAPPPWTTLSARQLKGVHPLERYFVRSEQPFGILIDGEGRALSTEIHSGELDALLQELLGPPYFPTGKLSYLDLASKANAKLTEDLQTAKGNNLEELPQGEGTFCGVRFQVPDALIELAGARLPDRPKRIEGITVGQKLARLYVLHGTGWGRSLPEGTVIGQYTVHYEDGDSVAIPIAYGVDIRDWWDHTRPVTRGNIAWTGVNPASREMNRTIGLYLTAWENPHPDKVVHSIDYCTTNTKAAPFCIAMTVEQVTRLVTTEGDGSERTPPLEKPEAQ